MAHFLDRTAKGTSLIPADTILQENRIIMLNKEVSSETTNDIIQRLLVLSQQSDKPITFIINTPGGDIQAGLALIDVINACDCPIYTIALGMAASMGAILLAAGEKGKRLISPYSRVMIHEPLLADGISGNCTTINAAAQSLLKRREQINKMLAEYTGRDMKEIEEATSYDHFMSAEEAKEFGIVDEICSGKELMNYLKGVNPDDIG